jgi:hypothetical protein
MHSLVDVPRLIAEAVEMRLSAEHMRSKATDRLQRNAQIRADLDRLERMSEVSRRQPGGSRH